MPKAFSAFGVAAVVALAVGLAGTSADAQSVMKQRGDQYVDHPAVEAVFNCVNNEPSSEKCDAPILPRVR
jgi:hypothetical protein